ncbi:diguanylate cyclase [Oceanicoccus sagamiensis]|uniref:diguanylate cyclase n=1 Tax=Oceanicoccus sagamiensis TaxID=716816 RepID=A0A1X9N970_9GAMM|nr:diguanylate cyclase [Oceanicoccus sagamiensis]ARN73731.1 diguanylate cyclase response regulator [Oceanicoccus sagamiensis]
MKKVLIVEDSSTVTKILKHLIKQHPDITALFAGSLAEGQALYEQYGDEIFAGIIDLNLPDAPNGEMVDYLLHKELPVIVLTANYQEDRREQLLDKGIVDYIIKESRYSYNYALNLIHRLEKNQTIKILIAEDSRPTRTFIKALLEKHLYQVMEASNGLEALDVLKDNPDIKLLITDYHMPEMDGFDLVRAIRHNVDKSGLVIIGLSGEGKGSLSAKFIKNGANDFLQKPFSHEELYCRVMHNIEELELIEQIQDTANRDYLTNLHNRRYYFDKGEVLYNNAVNNDTPFAVAMIDIDHFKQINDNYGHEAGDKVLVFLAEELRLAFSRFVVARLGGEEFSILMPGLSNEQAFTLLDKFRGMASAMTIDINADDGELLNISLSMGVTNYLHESLDQQLHYADQLLYRAKEAGRNMVVGDEDADE